MATVTVPVIVTTEAAQQAAQWGMEREFEQMIEHLQNHIAGLRSIEVYFDPGAPDAPDPGIVIVPILPLDRYESDHKTIAEDIFQWRMSTFRPEVYVNFCIILGCE